MAHDVHPYGGMERALFELVRRAADRVEFTVVSSTLDPALRPLVRWRRLPIPPRPFPLKFSLFFLLAPLAYRRRSGALVHTMGAIIPRHADIAAVHFCHAAFLAERRGADGRTPSWHRRLNGDISLALGAAAERWWLRSGRARIATAVSQSEGHELDEHYPDLPYVVVPNGVDRERFRPDPEVRRRVRQEHQLTPDDVVILFVGRRWEDKGLSIAIRALPGVCDAVDAPVQLWVVGTGDVAHYRTLAARHGVSSQVRFAPVSRQIETFYQAADLLVLPSIYETFSMVAYEAASSGIPVVATPVSGIRELLNGGACGIIVEREPNHVARALSRLAADPELRRRMGAEGRQRTGEFSWSVVTDQTVELYRSLLLKRSWNQATASQAAGSTWAR